MNDKLKDILPLRIYLAVKSVVNEGLIEEIRIRKGRQAYIIQNGNNRLIDIITTNDEMLSILNEVSHYSLYAFRDTIANGYISLGNGIRIGIIGRASIENNNIVGIYDISEFAIRLPHKIKVNFLDIFDIVSENSTLIYAPPGIGKTTLLRNLIFAISSGPKAKRIGVIDTRGELSFELEEKNLLVSILSGYPRELGIEIAVRTMNSQIIVCDEIGNEKDANAIIEAQGAGIPIIATCHGNSIDDIFSHAGIKKLHQAGIFNYYIGINRRKNFEFDYNIKTRKEVENDCR